MARCSRGGWGRDGRPYVTDTPITFEIDPPDGDEIGRRIATVTAAFPWLVAEEEGVILGYAYADRFRARAAYRWVAETAVYVAREQVGRGVGRSLYDALLRLLAEQGYVAAIGAVTLPNAASAALHESAGFVRTGTYERVGFKLGGWHDVGLWQRDLAPRMDAPAKPRPPR